VGTTWISVTAIQRPPLVTWHVVLPDAEGLGARYQARRGLTRSRHKGSGPVRRRYLRGGPQSHPPCFAAGGCRGYPAPSVRRVRSRDTRRCWGASEPAQRTDPARAPTRSRAALPVLCGPPVASVRPVPASYSSRRLEAWQAGASSISISSGSCGRAMLATMRSTRSSRVIGRLLP
jgi:hypothetical protein